MANSQNEIKANAFELAKLINSRIHDYARDSLQRFALVFSLGSIAISLLFTAAVRMFLVCPITRLHYDSLLGWMLKIILMFLLTGALFTFVWSLFHYVFAVFRRLHLFRAVRKCDKPKDKREQKLHEIWRKVSADLDLEKERSEVKFSPSNRSFNILRTHQIACYSDEEEFAREFAKLFDIVDGDKVDSLLGKVVINVLRDTYRIVQRTLIIDRWYFVHALRWLLWSFVLICVVNFILFLGAILMHGKTSVPETANGVKTLMLPVDGQLIDLDIYRPSKKAESRKFASIIIVPGGRGKNYVVDPNTGVRFRGYNDLASELAKRGFCVVVFDGRGQGRSEGFRSHENGLVDLRKVLDFAEGLSEVDTGRIGVFGRCGGASVALHLASKDTRIKSVMTWGMPPSFNELDRKKIEERLWQAGIRLKKEITFLNGEDAALNVRQPLLVSGGTEDTKCFFINGRTNRQLNMIDAISKRGTSKKIRFEVLRGAPHGVDSKHKCFEQFVDLVSEWFQDTLK